MPWGVEVSMGSRSERKCAPLSSRALDDVEEMADRASEAVEANDDQNVAAADFAHQPCKLRPGSRSARPMFLVNRRAAGGAQLIGLRVGGLILRRDARVAQKTSLAGRKRSILKGSF